MIRLALFVTCTAVLFATGCGSKGTSCAAKGSVSFAGQPVEDGALRFFPVEGTPGDGAGATISRGTYDIAMDKGLVAGKYRVSITATRSTGRDIRNPEPMPGEPAMVPEIIQYIPEQYNTRTTLQVELDAGENRKDFELLP